MHAFPLHHTPDPPHTRFCITDDSAFYCVITYLCHPFLTQLFYLPPHTHLPQLPYHVPIIMCPSCSYYLPYLIIIEISIPTSVILFVILFIFVCHSY